MKSLLLTLTAFGGAIVFALPSEPTADFSSLIEKSVSATGSFSIPLKLKPRGHSVNGGKNSRAAALDDQNSNKQGGLLDKRMPTEIASGGSYDAEYYAAVAFGTPAQEFAVVMDTGSPDTWVMGKGCGVGCEGSRLFDSKASKTFVGSTRPYSIGYGLGTFKGILASDTVGIADYSVPSQSIAIIDNIPDQGLDTGASGLMGLTVGPTLTGVGTPFFVTLMRSGKLASPVFTFQLNRRKHNGPTATPELGAGWLTFGVVDPKQYSGPITYVNVVSKTGFWNIPLEAITLNGKRIIIPRAQNIASIDTGTDNIIGPKAAVAAIYAGIPGSRPMTPKEADAPERYAFYSIPCDTTGIVKLSFGGRDFTISPIDFFGGPVVGKDRNGKNRCRSALIGLDDGDNPSWVIGTTFLTNVFAVFDAGSGSGSGKAPARVGFALPK